MIKTKKMLFGKCGAGDIIIPRTKKEPYFPLDVVREKKEASRLK